MPIEIVVGLPHLSEGPILQRARAMGAPALISANCLSRWKRHEGWREWAGWRLRTLANASGLASLDLDSGGFTAMVRYGALPWSVDAYMGLAASYPFRRFASLDYCCEEAVAADREEVLDRIARTIRTNRDCRMRAVDLGIADRFMPVIQGRLPTDYERCIDGLWHLMTPGTVIGVGSVCRRPIFGPEGLIAVFEHLDRVLPAGTFLHGFGVKGEALPYLRAFEHRVKSIDSQSYALIARYDANQRGISKTDQFVADHMERWTRRQMERRCEAVRPLQRELALPAPQDCRDDPWERAIAAAREEIRTLIEDGDLDHDEITIGWIEQWAADIYQAGVCHG
ncbi:deazapurine DNA modification protein DpdA family protein [Sphingomonas oryzagri]